MFQAITGEPSKRANLGILHGRSIRAFIVKKKGDCALEFGGFERAKTTNLLQRNPLIRGQLDGR
jgi:hypothetical protein